MGDYEKAYHIQYVISSLTWH